MADCQGAEDEANCPNKTCTEQQFSCSDGECIPHHERCNGFADCRDKTDEDGCGRLRVIVLYFPFLVISVYNITLCW